MGAPGGGISMAPYVVPCFRGCWRKHVPTSLAGGANFYDRFLDALSRVEGTAAKAQAGIKNTATAFGLLLDTVGKQLDKTAEWS